jgi:hypothetical protein
MAMANRQAGDPIGEVNRCHMAVAACRDEVADLEARLEGARGRLHRAAEQLVDWQAQADQVLAVSAQRSQTPDMLQDAKRVLAEQRVERMLAERSAGAPRRERRPFGGEVSRSHLECVHCLRENVDAETSALLHHDPTWNVPVSSAAQAEQAEQATAERRTYNAGRVITR